MFIKTILALFLIAGSLQAAQPRHDNTAFTDFRKLISDESPFPSFRISDSGQYQILRESPSGNFYQTVTLRSFFLALQAEWDLQSNLNYAIFAKLSKEEQMLVAEGKTIELPELPLKGSSFSDQEWRLHQINPGHEEELRIRTEFYQPSNNDILGYLQELKRQREERYQMTLSSK